MTKTSKPRTFPGFAGPLAASLVVAACSGSLDETVVQAGPGPDSAGPVEPGPVEPAASAAGPAYALAVAVWTDSGTTGYISLSDSIDRGDVSLEAALEVPGYPSIQAVGGQLLVANNEQLAITRYDVGADLGFRSRGALSFAGQGVDAVSFGNQYWQGDRVAYHELEVTRRVLWDPIGFEIRGLLDNDALPEQRDGLDLFSAFNRTEYVSAGEVVMPFSYHDQDWFRWSPNTELAVYDALTHIVNDIIEAPCPGLDSITEDESGNKYLGTWEYSTMFALMGTGAAPCVTRLNPDNTLDASWDTDLSDLTGGRLLKNFRYLGRGKAVVGVLHAEEYGPGYDFSRFAETTDDFWSNEGRYHRLWMIDIPTRSATPVTGIEFDFVQPYFSHAVLDGRFFVVMADGSSNQASRSVVYELDDDARATRKFEVPGDIRQWVKIR